MSTSRRAPRAASSRDSRRFSGGGALATLAALLAALWPALSPAADTLLSRPHGLDPNLTDRIIVKWRDSGVAAVQIDTVQDRTGELRASTGVNLTPVHTVFGRTDVVQLDYTPTHAQMRALLAQIESNPAVEYAEPDGWRYIQQSFPAGLPNDPHFSPSTAASNAGNPDLNYGSWVGQWYLLPSTASTPAAIDATTVWQSSAPGALGAATIVVAVLDTGVIEDHPDLAGKLQTPGYNFVSCDQGNYSTAAGSNTLADCTAGSAASYDLSGEAQGWNASGSDPGDYIDATDITESVFINASCTTVTSSSWHGTRVAGIIGAATNNGIGIAGIAPLTTLLPVRVIGKCGARVSDIAAAILWSAGQPVAVDAGNIASSPAANIINLSLGANTACSATEQSAITTATGAGVLVVAAAGNEGGAIDAPANCTGVASVVGLRQTGTKVSYSNLSSSDAAATIAAPGGNCVNAVTIGTDNTLPCLYDIETTSDAGSTTPASTPGFYTYSLLDQSYVDAGANLLNEANVGTSFAAPMVAGVAALMLAGNPSLTPAQLISRLQSSAVAFPTSSSTSSTACVLASDSTDANGNYVEPTGTPAECVCTTATCGAGMLNANAAVLAAEGMFAEITLSKTVATAGEHVTLNGSASTAAVGYTLVSYQWTTDPSTSDQIINPNSSVATLVVPSFRSISVILTITDNVGRTATATARVQSALGSGGGAVGPDGLWLLGLLAGAQLLRRRRYLN
jgi:serine protease